MIAAMFVDPGDPTRVFRELGEIGQRASPAASSGRRWDASRSAWSSLADVMQRVYRGLVDTPKTQASVREAALTDGLLRDLESWRSLAGLSGPEDWVFPSERLYALASPTKPTPLRKDTRGTGTCSPS